MDYNQIKKLLEEKGQTQLLKHYDELDQAGKQKLLILEEIVESNTKASFLLCN